MTEVLVLYYSLRGATAELARHVVRGVESVAGRRKARTVPAVSTVVEATGRAVPDRVPHTPRTTTCAHAAASTRPADPLGNMAAPLKYFLDGTSALWLTGALDRKPAGAFTSTGSSTAARSDVLTMLLPLLHHGMYVVGLPFTARHEPHAHRRNALRCEPLCLDPRRRPTERRRAGTRAAAGRRVAEVAVAVGRAFRARA